MKFKITFIVFWATLTTSLAQIYPFANNFLVNPILVNSALVAKENYLNVNLSSFRLFALPNAPENTMLTISKRYLKMGGSLQLLENSTGPYSSISLGGSYFYEAMLNYTYKLAFSLSSYLQMNQINVSRLQVSNQDPLLAKYRLKLAPQFGFSSILYSQKWVFGFSVANLLNNKAALIDYPLTANLYVSYFYRHPIELYDLNLLSVAGVNRENVYLEPAAIFYLKKILKLGGFLNLNYYYQQGFYPMAGIITGLNIKNRLFLTYVTQYDFAASNIFLARWHMFLSLSFKFIGYRQAVPRFF